MTNKELPPHIIARIIKLALGGTVKERTHDEYIVSRRWKLSLSTVSWDFFQYVSGWCTRVINHKLECDSEFFYHINSPYCVLKTIKELSINSFDDLIDFLDPLDVDCFSLFGDINYEEEDDFKAERRKISNFYDKGKLSEMVYGNVEYLKISGWGTGRTLPPFNFTNLKTLKVKTRHYSRSYVENTYTLKCPLTVLKLYTHHDLVVPMELVQNNFYRLTKLKLGSFRRSLFKEFLGTLVTYIDQTSNDSHIPHLEVMSFNGVFGIDETTTETLELLERFVGLLSVNLKSLDISQMLYKGDKSDFALTIQSIAKNHYNKNNHAFNNNNRDLILKVDTYLVNKYTYLLPISKPIERVRLMPPRGTYGKLAPEEEGEEGTNNYYSYYY